MAIRKKGAQLTWLTPPSMAVRAANLSRTTAWDVSLSSVRSCWLTLIVLLTGDTRLGIKRDTGFEADEETDGRG